MYVMQRILPSSLTYHYIIVIIRKSTSFYSVCILHLHHITHQRHHHHRVKKNAAGLFLQTHHSLLYLFSLFRDFDVCVMCIFYSVWCGLWVWTTAAKNLLRLPFSWEFEFILLVLWWWSRWYFWSVYLSLLKCYYYTNCYHQAVCIEEVQYMYLFFISSQFHPFNVLPKYTYKKVRHTCK